MANDPQDTDAPPYAAHAYPSKAFFIEMLTQDIGLSDCILDLIDNAIHSLVTKKNIDIVEHLVNGTKPPKIAARIDISFSKAKFTIEDNCGGITKKEATDQVFLLGKPKVDNKHTGLGVYGIGMKRAFFKMGKTVQIASKVAAETWQIDIDVDEWEQSKHWTFPFTEPTTKRIPAGKTILTVTDLHPPIATQFAANTFHDLVAKKVSTAYALFLKAGLGLKVNKTKIAADLPEIVGSAEIRPMRKLFKEDGVDILIMAGISPRSDRRPRGWYVFCNGRMVLAANQNDQTGWGLNEHPEFHSKFNHFVGYVSFRSKDVRKLPWTTTKDGIVRESPIYQRALAEMRVQSRPILDFFNRMYPDEPAQSEPEHKAFERARPVSLETVARSGNMPFEVFVPRATDDDLVWVSFKRTKRKIKKIKEYLDTPGISNGRVGEVAFDEFYQRHCK